MKNETKDERTLRQTGMFCFEKTSIRFSWDWCEPKGETKLGGVKSYGVSATKTKRAVAEEKKQTCFAFAADKGSFFQDRERLRRERKRARSSDQYFMSSGDEARRGLSSSLTPRPMLYVIMYVHICMCAIYLSIYLYHRHSDRISAFYFVCMYVMRNRSCLICVLFCMYIHMYNVCMSCVSLMHACIYHVHMYIMSMYILLMYGWMDGFIQTSLWISLPCQTYPSNK